MSDVKPKRKRIVKWQVCKYCSLMGIDPPYKSGKGRVFERHQTACEAKYRLRDLSISSDTPSVKMLYEIIRQMQKKQNEMAGRIKSLEGEFPRNRSVPGSP